MAELLMSSLMGLMARALVVVREHWRKIVAGDLNKLRQQVSQHVQDYMKETPQVKMKDKFLFTLGLMTISLSQWLILKYPNYFPPFWIALTSVLWLHRFIDYSAQKFQLFMLDYCYFVNLSVAIQIMVYPNNLGWFQANYVLSLGPICLAIITWKNSLVFHCLDKLTSFFLHACPPLMMHLYRWNFISNDLRIKEDDRLSFYGNFVFLLLIYGIWQISYLLITNIILHRYLRDKAVVTSYRYLMKGKKKQGVYMWIEQQLVRNGVLKFGEEVDPDTLLGKVIFVSVQLIYIVIIISPIRLIFESYTLSVIYIVFVFGVASWNGASYYIEIFRTRYSLKFENKPDHRKEKIRTHGDDYERQGSDFLDILKKLDLSKPEDLKLYLLVLESGVTWQSRKNN